MSDITYNKDTDQSVFEIDGIDPADQYRVDDFSFTETDGSNSAIKPKFAPLWPIPFGYTNFGESHRTLNKQLITDIETERKNNPSERRTFSKNNSGWQSTVRMEKKYKSFEELRKIILHYSLGTLHMSGISQDMHVDVNTLWANVIFAKGGWSNPHTHGSGNTIWSGVYYPKGVSEIENLDEFITEEFMTWGINETGGSLLIKDLNISKKLIKVKLDHEHYYGTNFSVIPRESLLVLFPAWVEHMVTPTTDDSKRYSISFAISRKTNNMDTAAIQDNFSVGDIQISDNIIKQQDNVTIEKV
jgi:hypothetical protein